jgi:ribosomal protein S18 acetylase RimI-like enzyme
MEIRFATLADAATISALNDDVQQLHAEALPKIFKPPSDETFAPDVVSALMKAPNHYFWLAIEDGQPVGYLFATVRHQPDTPVKQAIDLISIEQISIKPDARSKGYGKQMMETVMDFARQQGISLLTLDVWSFNTRAHKFYEDLGFRNYNERMWLDLG